MKLMVAQSKFEAYNWARVEFCWEKRCLSPVLLLRIYFTFFDPKTKVTFCTYGLIAVLVYTFALVQCLVAV